MSAQSKSVRIALPVFIALFLVPAILPVSIAYSASPNVLSIENSDTYAGYQGNTFGSNISYVQASWTVPSLTCPIATGTPQGQFFVGFGGWDGGFLYSCSGGAKYSPFFLVNSYYGRVSSADKVFAGDNMQVSVSVFANVWQIVLKDKTQRWEINNVSNGVSQGNIFYFNLAGGIPNPNFGTIKVTNACVTTSTKGCQSLKHYASSKMFGLAEYNWVNPSTGDTLATTTSLVGKSFTIVWAALS